MCGIAALLLRAPGPLGEIAAMTRALRHRGPDDAGYLTWRGEGRPRRWADPGDTPPEVAASTGPSAPEQPFAPERAVGLVALGHRRLSILDLSPAGHQPMGSPDGRWWITYNGEVYNWLELRAELERLGHRFLTRTDTEVVLAAWAAWGPGCLRRFVGMWAFVLVDLRARTAWAARDPFGIKPLFHAEHAGGVAFASEVKALRAVGAGRAVAPGPLHDYLASGLTDHREETLFEGVRALPAGTWLEVPLGGAPGAPRRYWSPPDVETTCTLEDAAREVRARFLRSVELHLRSDVAVGAALSGGVDSSSIVAAVRRVGGPALDLHAVSYVEDDPVIGEGRWVRLAAATAGAHVHEVRVRPDELGRDIDALIDAQDEPFGGTSIYAQFRVFSRAREQGIKVMLDGQGADELLAGYPNYFPARLAELLRAGRLRAAATFVRAVGRLPGADPRGVLRQGLGRLLPVAVARAQRRLRGAGRLPPIVEGRWFAERRRAPPEPGPGPGSPFRRELRRSLLTWLPSLLRYEDRNSMAHSVESRVPFLSTDLVELLVSLPSDHLLGEDGVTKRVLRLAMRGLVSDEVLDRRDKVGFATPERVWLQANRGWVERVLATARPVPALDLEQVRRLARGVLEGDRPWDASLWRALNLLRWAERTEVSWAV